MAGGEYREENLNSWREMWRGLIHGTSFHSLCTAAKCNEYGRWKKNRMSCLVKNALMTSMPSE
jgi:hypothetical protein